MYVILTLSISTLAETFPLVENAYRKASKDEYDGVPTSRANPDREYNHKPIVRERDNHHYTLDMGKNLEKTQPAPQRGIDGIAYTKAPDFRGKGKSAAADRDDRAVLKAQREVTS